MVPLRYIDSYGMRNSYFPQCDISHSLHPFECLYFLLPNTRRIVCPAYAAAIMYAKRDGRCFFKPYQALTNFPENSIVITSISFLYGLNKDERDEKTGHDATWRIGK